MLCYQDLNSIIIAVFCDSIVKAQCFENLLEDWHMIPLDNGLFVHLKYS